VSLFETTLIGTLAGALGTALGAVFSFAFKKPSQKTLGIMLGLSAGIMLAIIFMELLMEALERGLCFAAAGLLLGIFVFVLLDSRFSHQHFVSAETKGNKFLNKGILIAAGIALHNFPEGMAIGIGFTASAPLGATLAVLIALHNIPEGLAVSVPLNIGGLSRLKVLFINILAGLPMGLGALLGALLGSISLSMLALSFGFAAGAMLYIVCDELIPDIYQLTDAHASIWGITCGVLLGVLMIHYL